MLFVLTEAPISTFSSPDAKTFSSAIRGSILALVMASSLATNRTGSLKVNTIVVSKVMFVAPSIGLKATAGASESTVMNILLDARMELFLSSSTVAPMAA